MVGSGRKMSSYESVLAGSADVPDAFVRESALAQSDFSETVLVGSAELGTKPSCRHFRHHDSKSAGAPASPRAPGAAAALGWVDGRFAGILPASCTRSLTLAVL